MEDQRLERRRGGALAEDRIDPIVLFAKGSATPRLEEEVGRSCLLKVGRVRLGEVDARQRLEQGACNGRPPVFVGVGIAVAQGATLVMGDCRRQRCAEGAVQGEEPRESLALERAEPGVQ
eukprot:13453923-Heterocapsa_arctica.AAC.1